MNLERNLNPEQRKAVEHTEGPLLVLAGAGSGKTRCIIHRTAWLIREKKVPSRNILIVTFTNKAARELRERLEREFYIAPRDIWVGTFHSVSARILRREYKHTGFQPDFTIYDTDDQHSLMKKICGDLSMKKDAASVRSLQQYISHLKSRLITPDNFFKYYEDNRNNRQGQQVYQEYQTRLISFNAMDFDDLLLHMFLLLEKNEEVRDYYRTMFRYIMVDEYQDTNYAQFQIIHQLAQPRQNLCVVGDDDQAIYSWRGATIRNILGFERDYKDVLTIRLEQNYRSTERILNLANDLIRHNSERHPKKLHTAISGGSPAVISYLENEQDEAGALVQHVQRLIAESDISLSNIVVLYRMNAQSRVLEKALINARIPYKIVGGVNFYSRREVKDVLAYLRVMTNPLDEESLLRIINKPPRKIGKTSIEHCRDFALRNGKHLWDVLQQAAQVPELTKMPAKRIMNFTLMIQDWQKIQLPLADLIERLVHKTGLIDQYRDTSDPQDQTRLENITELVAAAREFQDQFVQENDCEPAIGDFLQNVTLMTDLDTETRESGVLHLMTIHNAKGLEFDHVCVTGVCDGIIPHQRSMQDQKNVEEERRLLYVAITRARKTLRLSLTKWRRVFQSMTRFMPSRFLREIDLSQLITDSEPLFQNAGYIPRCQQRPEQPNVTLESEKHFRIGQTVEHETLGRGTILSVDGKDENAKLAVSFRGGSLKKVIGKYVKVIPG